MSDILIGLGGTGGKILKAFRQRLWTEFDSKQREGLAIEFIYVDTDNNMINPTDISYQTIHGNCCFEPTEFVDIKTSCNIDNVFANPQGYKRVLGILGNVNETQAAVCPVGAAADQKRRAGRILFAANIDAYIAKLNDSVRKVRRTEIQGIINVHIFAGLAGGTGSGSIIDAIAQTRKWFFSNNFNENQFRIVAFCQLPEDTPPATWSTGRYKANGYGALLELNQLFTSMYNKEWKDKTFKPCYDITSHTDYARLYLDYETPSPDNLQKGRIPQSLKIANGLMLYSNKNDFGYTIDTERTSDLSRLVADFVYAKIFMPGGPQNEELNRFYNFENLSNFRTESDETADAEEGIPVPVRTKAIGSFGIKRVIVPEEKIKEHVAYVLGLSILYQMKYNNWNNTLGFRDEIVNFAPLTYLNAEDRKNKWMLTSDHLMLKKYILQGDKNEGWQEGEFSQTYWNAYINVVAPAAKNTDYPFNKLDELCKQGYAEGFRGVGVENFYNDKSNAAEAYAKEISLKVEQELFNEWYMGKLAYHSILNIMEELINMTVNRKDTINGTIVELSQKFKHLEGLIETIKNEYLNAHAIKRPFILNNRYERVVELSKQLCIAKTEYAACNIFASKLLDSLIVQFSDLKNRIENFSKQVDLLVEKTKERLTHLADLETFAKSENDGTQNMTLPIIEYYDRAKLLGLENRILTDSKKMNEVGMKVRTCIAEALQSDGQFKSVNRMNVSRLTNILLEEVYPKILTYHDEFCTEKQNKVLGVPILSRLQHKFDGKDNELRQFAENLIVASGFFSEINMNEIQMNIPNNQPPIVNQNIKTQRIIVTLPKTEAPELIEFAETLKQKLENAIGGGFSGSVTVGMNGQNPNEILLMGVVNGYPMRAISALQMLKAEYEHQITLEPNNRIVLHTENEAKDYRDLFVKQAASPAEIRDLYVPYLILDLGLGKIQYDEDSGEYGEMGEKDFFGNSTISPWGKTRFIDIPYDDHLMSEKYKSLKKMFEAIMEEAFGEIDCSSHRLVETKKKELQQELMSVVGKVIKTENPAPKSKYNEFVRWTENAIKILMSYKPQV